jgi:hypothetical protein
MGNEAPTAYHRLKGVIDLLRVKTLYSESDFKAPIDILSMARDLSKLNKDKTKRGELVNKTNVLFSNLLFEKKSNGDSFSNVDSNQLMATLFALSDKPNENDSIIFKESQDEVNFVIKSLLTQNDDFIIGKKYSTFIQPIYLVMRALREEVKGKSADFLWIDSVFSHLSIAQRETIFQETYQLIDKLLSTISSPDIRNKLANKLLTSFNPKLTTIWKSIKNEISIKPPTKNQQDITEYQFNTSNSESIAEIKPKTHQMPKHIKKVGVKSYLKKEFKSPSTILEEAADFAENKFGNYDHFVSKTTKVFEKYKITGNIKDIDPGSLIAILSALKVPKESLSQEIGPIINPIMQKLQGEETGFATGKKSYLVQPIYIILRSLKEKDVAWLNEALGEATPSHRKNIIELAKELSVNLTDILRQPYKKMLLDIFNESLNFEKIDRMELLRNAKIEARKKRQAQKEKVESDKKKGKLYAVSYRPNHYLSEEVINSVENTPLPQENLERLTTMKDVLEYSMMSLDGQGEIKIYNQLSQMSPELYENSERLREIFGTKNYWDISLASLISALSNEGGGKDSTGWIFNSHGPTEEAQVRKITTVFEKSIKAVFNPSISKELDESLKKSIENGHIDLSYFNEKIAEIIFQIYSPGESLFPAKLLKFVKKTPGVRESVIAFRKLYLLKIIQNEIKSIPQAINDQAFIVRPDWSVWDTMNNDFKKYKKLLDGRFMPGDFVEYDSSKILNQYVLFSVEKAFVLRKQLLYQGVKIPNDENDEIFLGQPPNLIDLNVDKILFITDQGIIIPINLVRLGEKINQRLQFMFAGTDLGHIPIALEK